MQTEFLTSDEIQQLTCYRRKAEQRQALLDMGVQFIVNRLGWPLVRRAELDRLAPSGKAAQKQHKVNLAAIQGGKHG